MNTFPVSLLVIRGNLRDQVLVHTSEESELDSPVDRI